MKIGDRELAVTRPADLDVALIERTGCNAAEVSAMLAGAPLAGFVAAALSPFLSDDAPSVPELAVEIEAAGVGKVAADVRRLLRRRRPAGGTQDEPASTSGEGDE